MNDADRRDVLTALRKTLRITDGECDAKAHPLVALWSSAELDICKTIVDCFAQYTNLQDWLDAEAMANTERAQIKHNLDELVAKHKDSSDATMRDLLATIAVESRSLGKSPTPYQLRELSLKVIVAKRIDGYKNSKRSDNYAATTLSRVGDKDALVCFLKTTDELAVALNAKFLTVAKEEFFLAGFLRAHLDGPRKKQNILNVLEEPLCYAQEPDVQFFAQEAYALEDALLQTSPARYPPNYRQPMGFSAKVLKTIGLRHRHPYYSARLACAALMMLRCPVGELSCRKWALRIFLSKQAVRQQVYEIPIELDLSGASDFAKAVYQHYNELNRTPGGKEAFFAKPLTSEYNAAWEWQESLGKDGSTAVAAEELLKGTRGDASFVLKVLGKLLQSNCPNVAPIALAGKLGAYFQDKVLLGEPTCKDGDKDGPDSATAQIKKIRNLCNYVALNSSNMHVDRVVGGIIFTTVGSLYYEDWPDKRILRDDFKWKNHGPSDWKERTSYSHLENRFAPMAHLWLYGKGFQELVDHEIAEVGESLSNEGTTYLGDGDRFARFIFLIPKCRREATQKVLRDFPGEAAMKRVLHCLGGTESVEWLSLKSDLYEPIVFHKPLSPDNSMFKVSHSNE